MTLLNKIKSINYVILKLSAAVVTKILLFRDNTLSSYPNTLILKQQVITSYLLKDLMTPF